MKKSFDCVAMKNEIQARLLREKEGLSAEERVTAMRSAADHSRSPIGDLWRKLRDRGQARIMRIAESSTDYSTKPSTGSL